MLGGFHTALFFAIEKADDINLERLAKGFPDEVAGYRAWAYNEPYSLYRKLKATGLNI